MWGPIPLAPSLKFWLNWNFGSCTQQHHRLPRAQINHMGRTATSSGQYSSKVHLPNTPGRVGCRQALCVPSPRFRYRYDARATNQYARNCKSIHRTSIENPCLIIFHIKYSRVGDNGRAAHDYCYERQELCRKKWQDQLEQVNLESACVTKRESALETNVLFPIALQLD